MAGNALHLAVVGASTLLGKELVDELSQSAPATWDVTLLDEGDDLEGQLTSAGDEAMVLHALSDRSMDGKDLVIFAGDAALTSRYLDRALQSGAGIIDLTGVAQGRTGFLLRWPWMEVGQRPDLTTDGVIVPHPASLMLGLVGARVEEKFGPVQLVATVLEPASQAGAAGVDELHQQTVNLLSFQEVPKEVFGTQVAFNLQGSHGTEQLNRLTFAKQRITEEVRSLLTPAGGSVTLDLLQAPVFHGYTVSLYLRTAQPTTPESLQAALRGGVVVTGNEVAPSNQAATESGDLLISVTSEISEDRGVWLLLAADNLRLTARAAVASAVELAALRPGSRVH